MELYVYNHNLELAGIIDTASSVIWHRRYYTFGDFEIHVPAGEIEIPLIQKQYIVTKPNAVEFGIIEYITIEQGENGDFIKAVGRFGSSLLARRIIFETTVLNTTVENAMRTIVYDNAINTTITDRIIPNLELGDLNSFTETVSFQVTYRNLANTLKSLAETSGISYRVIFDPVDKKFKFETYKALDRSIEQSTNPRAIFSNDYDNLLTSIYQTSDIDYSNVALVGGEGEGEDRKLIIVGSATGLDRYEVFVNAKEIQMEDGITEPEYFAMLAQKGAESLLPKVENFEGNVLTEGTLKYKEDYDLGDIVTIENTKWNKRISVQITEVTEVDDDNGFQVIPVFGIASQTLKESLSGVEDTSGSGGGSIIVTPNRVIVSNAEGKAIASDITANELEYLDGVTSNIQTQLNNKQENITGAASTIVSSNLIANRALVSDASGKVAVSAATSAELGYLDGVTSSVQSQLNDKANSSHTHDYLPSGGTAENSNKLAGYSASSDATGSSVAVRNSSADLYARLFRSTYVNQSDISGAIAFRKSTSDNYIRFCSSPTAVRDWIGADKAITASGLNSNGYYILFADGTQICWRDYDLSDSVGTAWGGNYTSGENTITFARAFTSLPAVIVTTTTTTNTSTSWTGQTYGTTIACKFVILRFTSLGTVTWNVRMVAIGRG